MSRQPESRLEEAVRLSAAIDLELVVAEVVPVNRVQPGTLFGSGTVDRIGDLVHDEEIDIVVVDVTLTPIQQRNLERAWNIKVIDRTGLILEIFGARANTREGTLQVELASLSYQRSRLVRSWTHLERQRGGTGFLGGPGETQIESDRRAIDNRIIRLKKDLEDVRRTRELHRKARRRVPYPVIALVGYTNAGKSTLFNRLTNAHVVAKDQLFATLDPTMREIRLPSRREAIMSDTVGFISELPHELVSAFRATLEEVTDADVIVHVRDAAHDETDAQKRDVLAVLAELGIDGETEGALIEVLNKIDLLDDEERAVLENRVRRSNQNLIAVSARTGAGCDELLDAIEARLSRDRQEITVSIPWEQGALLAWLYETGVIIDRQDTQDTVEITVQLDPADVLRFEQRRAEVHAH